ncbi:hypothetical protein M9458_046243, partial [Cirrhinus mrigala]
FLLCLPDMFYDKTRSNATATACYDTTTDEYIGQYLKYSIGRTVVGFVIPLLIMICCYGHVAFVLVTKKDIDIILKLRCLRLVVILTLLFSICFIPYHVFRNLNLATRIFKMDKKCLKWYSNVYIANQV